MTIIRLARPDEIARVLDIEDAAGQLYLDLGFPADLPGLSASEVSDALGRQLLWVLTPGQADTAIAFALCWQRPETLHLHEIDVHPEHSRQGLGRRLIEHVCTEAAGRGLSQVTLTTFSQVPWNAPYYARCGFKHLQQSDWPPWLAEVRAREARLGLDRWPRCAMSRTLE